MAKNINKDTYNSQKTWDAGVMFNRNNALPIDKFSVFFSKEEADTYALTNPIAYIGQILTVLTYNGETVEDVKVYVIDENSALKEFGGAGTVKAVTIIEHEGDFYESTDTEYTNPLKEKGVTSAGTYIKTGEGDEVSYSKIEIDLSDYYTKSETDTLITAEETRATAKEDELEDKISDLSTAIDNLDSSLAEEIEAREIADEELEEKIIDLSTYIDGLKVPEYTITKDTTSGDYAAAYHLTKDGIAIGETINIPKDLVVRKAGIVDYDGEASTITVDGETVAVKGAHEAGKYVVMLIQNDDESQVWLDVKDLVDVYTKGEGIEIDSNNVISIDENVVATKEYVNTEVAEVSTTITDLSTYVDTKVDFFEGELDEISERLDDVDSSIDGLKAEDASLEAAINDINTNMVVDVKVDGESVVDENKVAVLPHIPAVKKYDATAEFTALMSQGRHVTPGSDLIDKVFTDIYNNDIVILQAGKYNYMVTKFYGQNATADFRAVSLVATSFVDNEPTKEMELHYGTLYCIKNAGESIEPTTYFVEEKFKKSDIEALSSTVALGDKLKVIATISDVVDGVQTIELKHDVATSNTSANKIASDGNDTLASQGYVDNIMAWETL